VDIGVLALIQRRVPWLSTRIIHEGNHVRPNPDGSKVGGHQASSASVVSILTAVYFAWLRQGDRVAVKPHASPAYHAVQYLLGNLDRGYLSTPRQFGGLQAYPSRTKHPDPVDFSTGSVGLGVAATLFAAHADRYATLHFREQASPRRRFVALVGDAELDEANIWVAISDPSIQDGKLGNVLWIVDLNRQNLDRVVPGVRATQLPARPTPRRLDDCPLATAENTWPTQTTITHAARAVAAPPYTGSVERGGTADLERVLAADAVLDAGHNLVQRFRAAPHDLDVTAFKQWLPGVAVYPTRSAGARGPGPDDAGQRAFRHDRRDVPRPARRGPNFRTLEV
jgi:transketolase N-terminal domain/subunit